MRLTIKEKLLGCAKNELIFEATLRKLAMEIPKDARFELLAFCYFQFSDLYPEILVDVLYDKTIKTERLGKQTSFSDSLIYLSMTKQPN